MRSMLCVLMGYLLGSVSPAALVAKLKGKDLRVNGTGNLGATNTMLVFGKLYGVIVMVIDVGKAYISAKLAALLFPRLMTAGLLAGLGAVLGHVFPFYMHFHGGKGLAAYAGMVLSYHPAVFLGMLIACVCAMLVVNYTYVVPLVAAVLFPLLVAVGSQNLWMTLVAVVASVVLVQVNWSNIDRAKRGDEKELCAFLKEDLHNIK